MNFDVQLTKRHDAQLFLKIGVEFIMVMILHLDRHGNIFLLSIVVASSHYAIRFAMTILER